MRPTRLLHVLGLLQIDQGADHVRLGDHANDLLILQHRQRADPSIEEQAGNIGGGSRVIAPCVPDVTRRIDYRAAEKGRQPVSVSSAAHL